MPDFIHYIEFPITISYDYQPDEPATKTYPGCKADVTVNDVSLSIADLPIPDDDELKELCWEDIEKRFRKNYSQND
jgi:hypothetical protein